MKFIVYETTNTVNGKRYRGAHACDHEVCCYFGSGLLFKKALAKHGADSFSRETLLEVSSIEEMFEAEAKLVDAAWVEDPNTYNLKVGGEGGWDYINKNGIRWNDEKRRLHSIEMKKRRAAGLFKPHYPTLGMLGKKHSDKAKKNISLNSAQRLSLEEIEKRKADLALVKYPSRGSVKKLCELWNVSHTQVARFCKQISL